MVAFAINQEAQKLAVPVTLRCRVTCEREVFVRQYRGAELGSLPDLHVPTGARYLKTLAVDSAKRFIVDMGAQGNLPLTEPLQFKLFGPYKSRTWTGGKKKARGEHMFEDKQPESADFILEGQFLATRGKVIETA